MTCFPRTFSLLRLLSLIAAFANGWSPTVDAAPIQFRLTGTIDVLYQVGPLPDGIAQDASFTASLSFDLATPDDRPADPRRGYYLSNGMLRVQAGPSIIDSTGPLSFFVGDDVDDVLELFEFPDDTFTLRDNQLVGNFEHSPIALMGFRWNDPTRTAFASDALPTTLDASSFVEPYIQIFTLEADPRVSQFSLRGIVDSITLVPEPRAVALAALCIFLGLQSRTYTSRLSRHHGGREWARHRNGRH